MNRHFNYWSGCVSTLHSFSSVDVPSSYLQSSQDELCKTPSISLHSFPPTELTTASQPPTINDFTKSHYYICIFNLLVTSKHVLPTEYPVVWKQDGAGPLYLLSYMPCHWSRTSELWAPQERRFVTLKYSLTVRTKLYGSSFKSSQLAIDLIQIWNFPVQKKNAAFRHLNETHRKFSHLVKSMCCIRDFLVCFVSATAWLYISSSRLGWSVSS